ARYLECKERWRRFCSAAASLAVDDSPPAAAWARRRRARRGGAAHPRADFPGAPLPWHVPTCASGRHLLPGGRAVLEPLDDTDVVARPVRVGGMLEDGLLLA